MFSGNLLNMRAAWVIFQDRLKYSLKMSWTYHRAS